MARFLSTALGLWLCVTLTTAGCSSSPPAFSLGATESEDGLGGAAAGGGGAGSLACGAVDRAGGTCSPIDPTNLCQACVEVQCCAEQSACNSTAPATSCAFGSTLFEGAPVEGGEIGCMMECFAGRADAGSLGPTEQDVDDCAEACAASECGRESAEPTTRALATCIVGLGAAEGCASECGFTP